MRIRQWEIWKGRPEGFVTDHWFVLISGQERADQEQAQGSASPVAEISPGATGLDIRALALAPTLAPNQGSGRAEVSPRLNAVCQS